MIKHGLFSKSTSANKKNKNDILGGLVVLLFSFFVINHSVSAADYSAQPGSELVVCTVDHPYSGLLGSQAGFSALRSKLENPDYFGTTGSISKNTFKFEKIVGRPTAESLTGCNIWFSVNDKRINGDEEGYIALADFAANGGFVIGSCSTSSNFGDYDSVCKGLGYGIKRGKKVVRARSVNTSTNPLACVNGELSAEDITFSQPTSDGPSYFLSNNNSTTLFTYSPTRNKGVIITDSLVTPTVLLTGSKRMWTGFTDGVTHGQTVSSTIDHVVISAWKLAADTVTGLKSTDGSVDCAVIVPPTPAPKSITITTDTNNDGVIDEAELENSKNNNGTPIIIVRVELPDGLAVDDQVIIGDFATDADNTIILTADDLARGYIDFNELPVLADGGVLKVGAMIISNATDTESEKVEDVVIFNIFIPTIGVHGFLTNNPKPLLRGTTNQPDGAKVFITQGNQLICQAIVNSGRWKCTPESSLSEGVNTLRAITSDASEETVTRHFNVTVDTLAPIIQAADIGPINHSNPTLIGSTNQQDQEVVRVTNIAGDLVCSATIHNSGWSCQATNLADGVYQFSATTVDPAGNIGEATFTVTIDTIKPVITLNGNASVTVEAGTAYTDAGASVSDSFDVTVSVVVGGDTVNTAVPATYTIKYNATDAAGNVADEVTRTVIVKDTLKPAITLKGGASVTVEAGTTYIDAGASVADSFDTMVTVVVTNPVNTAVPATYTVKYNATDAAGNKATEVTRTVIVKDTLKPAITLKGGASVTVEAGTTYTDAGASVADSFDTTVTVVVTNPVKTTVPATYTVKYNATDAAGNKATEVTRTVIVLADTAPSPTVTTEPNHAMTGDEVTTVITGVEAGARVKIDGMSCPAPVDGTVTCNIVVGEEKPEIIIEDSQGNASAVESDLTIDDTPEEPQEEEEIVVGIGSTHSFLLLVLGLIALMRRKLIAIGQ